MNDTPWINWRLAGPLIAIVAVLLAIRWGGHPCEKYEWRTVQVIWKGVLEYRQYKVCVLR